MSQVQDLEKQAAALRERLAAPTAESMHLARLEHQIAAAKAPRRITPRYSNIEDALRDREQIVRRIEWSQKEYALQVQHVRDRYKGAPEAHVVVHINNTLGMGARLRKERDEASLRALAEVDAQIELLKSRNPDQPLDAA